MAQTEDTELRDLVVEALEKNGSLAKIRALLRANIFLAFEDDYENIKQNLALDQILKLPEGILSLSIVYEFLEFCNLKNTLFVYKSETRHGKEYKYEGKNSILNKLNLRRDGNKEPVLVSMLKGMSKVNQSHSKVDNHSDLTKDDQNCTYIVHEDSSSTSNSNSDNSSDEKTKLQLRLPLDNSDTDTSSDSTRDKSSSEYIPNEHIVQPVEVNTPPNQMRSNVASENLKNNTLHGNINNTLPYFLTELKITNNSSSDSTSYVELKPFNITDKNLINTTGVPTASDDKSYVTTPPQNEMMHNENTRNSSAHKVESQSPTLNSVSSSLLKNKTQSIKNSLDEKKSPEQLSKSDTETAEYSYDFTLSGASRKDMGDVPVPSSQFVPEEITNENGNKNPTKHDSSSPHDHSQSSVSISDVADLISEKSLSIDHTNHENESLNNKSNISKSQNSNKSPRNNKSLNNDSGDFSESPVPSLSNLSLDIHSD